MSRGLHTITREEPLYTALASDFGAPGPIIDFQAPLTHTLIAANTRKKGKFEKLFLEGRPPINIGVTNNGDILGGTQITFSDVLGDQQFSFFAASQSQYRTLAFSYLNLSRRFQYALQAFSQEQFFFGLAPGALFGQNLSLPESRRRDRRSNDPWWEASLASTRSVVTDDSSSQPARSITTNGLPTQA